MGAIDLLQELNLLQPASKPYDGMLVLAEHEEKVATLASLPSTDVVTSVRRLFGSAATSRLLQVSFRLDLLGRPEVCLKASSLVGFSAMEEGGRRVFVSVKPKISGVRLLELAFLADRLPTWRPDIAVGEDTSTVLVEWTLRAYLHAVRSLLTRGGLRATHERVQAELSNRVRGKLLVAPLLKRLAGGRPDRILCEYAALELDNSYNRLLKWALHVGSLTLGLLPHLSALRGEYQATERAFGGVALVEPRLRELNASTIPSNLAHYRDSFRLAKVLLERCSFQAEAGSFEAVAVVVDMNDLYQRAFFNAIKKQEPSASSGPHWNVSLVASDSSGARRSTSMIPDVFVPATPSRCAAVLDTKWKEVLSAIGPEQQILTSADADLVRINSSDLYQITAYAVECLRRSGTQSKNTCLAALVYPATSSIPDFGYDVVIAGIRVLIRLVAWDLSLPVSSSLEALWGRLQLLRLLDQSAPNADSDASRPPIPI